MEGPPGYDEHEVDECAQLFHELRWHSVTDDNLRRLEHFYGAFIEYYGFFQETAPICGETWGDLITSITASEFEGGSEIEGPDGANINACTLHVALGSVSKRTVRTSPKMRFAPLTRGSVRTRTTFCKVLSVGEVQSYIEALNEYIGMPSFEWGTGYACHASGSSGPEGFGLIGLKYHSADYRLKWID
jgi:hypothetical protein